MTAALVDLVHRWRSGQLNESGRPEPRLVLRRLVLRPDEYQYCRAAGLLDDGQLERGEIVLLEEPR